MVYENKNYAYDFEIYIGERYSAHGIAARVKTDKSGIGTITLERRADTIPINLIGKGQSKARKKAVSIAKWWLETTGNYEHQKRVSQIVPHQKRVSQRARKRTIRASRRAHSSGYALPHHRW